MMMACPATAAPVPLAIDVRPDVVERVIQPARLAGGNLALWYEPAKLESPEFDSAIRRWKPGILRMPGGSWSDEYFWNGNGVRKGDVFDMGKRVDGRWQVDYSGWAPGFRLKNTAGDLAEFHGNTDVRSLHEFIRKHGADCIVTVNAGTGSPEMAAEWVRWANKKQGYAVGFWEVGNELDGEWEMGHFGKDGKPMDAAAYAKRFCAFAKAMKAVDPGIKTGGPASSNDKLEFVETLIKEAGADLDFVTFHTYPVLAAGKTEAQRYAQADDVGTAVGMIRAWIKQYQPAREQQVQIGVTEWHKQVMETRATVDLSSGLWACLFLGTMADSGVDFANQWDCFSAVHGGGHGLFDKSGGMPRAMYHALVLWTGKMQEQWLRVEGGDTNLHTYATKGKHAVQVMLVNTSEQARDVVLTFARQAVSGTVNASILSAREYLWNPFTNAPEWTTGPRESTLAIGSNGQFTVPANAVMVVEFPDSGHGTAVAKSPATQETELDILLPEISPADQEIEGYVVWRDKASRAASLAVPTGPLQVSATGARIAGATTLDLSQAVASFTLKPDGPGRSVVKANMGSLSAERAIEWTKVEEQARVIWEFADAQAIAAMQSNYALALDGQVRPNQTVAAIRVANQIGAKDANSLLAITSFPKDMQRGDIGGLIAKLGASADLTCSDPGAAVQIVMQSNLDHWIQIAEIPIAGLAGKMRDIQIRLDKPAAREAMKELYALRFQLKADKPLTGRIYMDDLGFIFRHD